MMSLAATMAEAVATLACLLSQGLPVAPGRDDGSKADPAPASPRIVEWREGRTLRVRVPVATPDRELMTAVAFPEERVETAISGWPEGSITATARGGLLFLRLTRMGQGHLNVIGGSKTHYLLHVEGVARPQEEGYDAVLKIRREGAAEGSAPPSPLPRAAGRSRPVGSLELMRAMRLGLKPEGGSILRAGREVAFRSERVEIRLLYVYRLGAYLGRVYEVENLTERRQPLDASRLRAKDEILVLSGLKENVLGPRATTRLYTVFWKD
jgi:hypothetical protein